jgi:hypothetical protein
MDIVKLSYRMNRKCRCKSSEGKYVNIRLAEVSGPCRVLGIVNEKFSGETEGVWFEIQEPDEWIKRVD